jgi:hypothetical protein
MRNRHSIFVNGFSRGGTTILTNLLASHPHVCLMGEIHHVFKGASLTDTKWRIVNKCLWHDAPIILRQAQDFFSPRLIKSRKPLSRWAKRRIDQILYREKLHSQHPAMNRYKSAEQTYLPAELAASRMLCKCIDGMILTTDAWRDMYPDAVFFGLVRNGLAICEGHLRRGRSAAEIGWRYNLLVRKMISDAEKDPNYHLIRFEDLLQNPWQTLQAAYARAGLDASLVQQVRMQARRVMDAQGNHRLCGKQEWELMWLKPPALDSYLQRDVDKNQIKRLSKVDQRAFLQHAAEAMEMLGYTAEPRRTVSTQTPACFVVPFPVRSRLPTANAPNTRAA